MKFYTLKIHNKAFKLTCYQSIKIVKKSLLLKFTCLFQKMKRKFLILFYICILIIQTSAQTVSNVTAEQVDKTIHVSYDLDMQAEISLHLSIDGGKTYTQLYKVSGDVGKNITKGHKTIIWDVLAEQERLVGDDIVFKVQAKGASSLEFTVKGVTFKMIYVEGGTFTMGCTSEQGDNCYKDEYPSHQVTLSDFYMGETEVTQALWRAVMGSDPSCNGRWTYESGRGNSYPAYRISWNECQEFIRKLNQLTGKTFLLPTEAQWEYAARGGNKSKGYKYAGGNTIDEVAWFITNSGSSTHPVKGKQANELGLYDMSGNVWEWCSDLYGSYSSSSQTNPTGSSSGSKHILRGGGWFSNAYFCRVAVRSGCNSNDHVLHFGFRLSLVQ